jgi:DNA-binding NarL/FixJ family response regulator
VTTGAPRVVVADDQDLVRAGFRLILERGGLEVVGDAGDGAEAVRVTLEQAPDVVLMDVRMPRMDGIEATRRIVAARSEARVLVLTTFDLDQYVYAAVSAGASGFLLKDVPPDDLVHAVRLVARGESMLAPAVTRRLLDRFTQAPPPGQLPSRVRDLAEREKDVLRLVAAGLSNTEIGAELHLSVATVKTYVSRLLSRLDLRDRVQLAVLAYESGLVTPGRR